MGLKNLLHTEAGRALISIILGLGLAALFRKACRDNRCLVIKGPEPRDVQQHLYRVNDECYQYEPVFSECPVAGHAH